MGQKGQNSGDTQDDGLEKPTSGERVSGENYKRDKEVENLPRRNSTLIHGLGGGRASVHRPRRKDSLPTGRALPHRDAED